MEICTSCTNIYPSNCECEDASPQACTECLVCGELIEGHTEDYCEYCAGIEECWNCGEKILDGDDTCQQCGHTN